MLYDYNGTSIEERQLYKDIAAMEREAAGGVVIERVQDGKRKYLRYSDPSYSLFEPVITQQEAQLLSDTIQLLSRFKGLPQFDWLDETMARLRQTFQLDDDVAGAVSFQQNPYLRGLKWFGDVFDAIVKKEVLEITYHHFGKKPRVRIVHPYQLRQSSDRWYLVGYEERQETRHKLVMLPLDRVDDVQVLRDTQESGKYKFREKPVDLDIDDYFYDIVGVSLNPESEPEKIVLKVGYPDAEYMLTKPIHASQRLVERIHSTGKGLDHVRGYMIFEMELIPNEEFIHQLLTYAHNAEVVKPKGLREKIYKRAKAILEHNKIEN